MHLKTLKILVKSLDEHVIKLTQGVDSSRSSDKPIMECMADRTLPCADIAHWAVPQARLGVLGFMLPLDSRHACLRGSDVPHECSLRAIC